MTDFFSETEVLAVLPGLTRLRLNALIEAQVVIPVVVDDGHGFRRIDLARLELLCELSDEFDLDEDALSVVMSLLDKLHTTRRDLWAVCKAVAAEDPEVCRRIGAAVIAMSAE